MKKILSIALVALLAVSSVFAADFSGSASLNFGYDFESKKWGFDNDQSTKIDITAEFKSGSVDSKGEGDIYAGIKAAFKVNFVAKKGTTSDFVGLQIPAGGASISEAYVTNGEWKVSILSAAGAKDFATSAAIDGNSKVTYAPAAPAAPGVTVTYKDYTVGFGIAGDTAAKTIDWSASVATPAYTLAEGLTANFAVAAADDTVVAASANVAYDADVDASLKADFGYSTADKAFDFDVAANLAVAPVTVDAYYNYGKNMLKAQAVVDLAPFKVTVADKDILNTHPITASVEYKVSDALTVKANGGYTVASKEWSVGASAEYKVEAYTAKAGIDYKSAKVLTANASIESAAIIPGATLKLAYAPSASSNLLNKAYGAVNASCTIAF